MNKHTIMKQCLNIKLSIEEILLDTVNGQFQGNILYATAQHTRLKTKVKIEISRDFRKKTNSINEINCITNECIRDEFLLYCKNHFTYLQEIESNVENASSETTDFLYKMNRLLCQEINRNQKEKERWARVQLQEKKELQEKEEQDEKYFTQLDEIKKIINV